MEATSLRFAAAARVLGDAARAAGMTVPSFRSPPRVVGRSRTIRRRADGSATVAIVLRDRPWPGVLADMIEGIVTGNAQRGAEADRLRDTLWSALMAAGEVTPTDQARAA